MLFGLVGSCAKNPPSEPSRQGVAEGAESPTVLVHPAEAVVVVSAKEGRQVKHGIRIDALVHIVQGEVEIVENLPHHPHADHAVFPLRAADMVGVTAAANPVQEVASPAGGVVRTRDIRVTTHCRAPYSPGCVRPGTRRPGVTTPGVVMVGCPRDAFVVNTPRVRSANQNNLLRRQYNSGRRSAGHPQPPSNTRCCTSDRPPAGV